MRTKSSGNKKTKAQAMVEFALVLMLLLTLLYGILEAGRLLFIYASTVTAARQAVRYGSTTGTNGGGTLYYADCAGIKQAVKAVGFIAAFTDGNIHITYDRGLDSGGNPIAIDSTNFPLTMECESVDWVNYPLRNGDRIRVQVSVNWQPVVNFIGLNAFTITKNSARTILSNVSIAVTSPPQGWIGTNPGALGLAITASPTTYTTVGQVIAYTYTLVNTGTVTLSAPFGVTDNKLTPNCSGTPASLAAGASTTCTSTYVITQADLDAGVFTNQATATASGASSGQVTKSIVASQNAVLSLTKNPNPARASVAGTPITYTYTLTNSGNVTLSAPYTVSDNLINNVNCPSTNALSPGTSTQCSATYTIKNSDISAGFVTNQATATAKLGGVTITSNQATAYVGAAPLEISVAVSPLTVTLANQVIGYTYTITNYSGGPVSSPYVIDTKATVNCSGAAGSLADGASTTCTGTYTVTQANMDAGGAISSQVTAKANGGAMSSGTVPVSVPIAQSAALTLSIGPTPTYVTTVGQTVNFQYTISNSGNVTLSSPYSVISLVRNDAVTIPVTCSFTGTLAPAATTNCQGSLSVIQQDIDGIFITNHAVGIAQFGGQTIGSAQQTGLVATYNGPRLGLTIAANPTSALSAGILINYTYTLTNTGNVQLTSPYAVSGAGLKGTVDCSAATSPLPMGASTTCIGTYSTTAADILAGSFTNTATASALNGATTITSNTATATVTTAFACSLTHSGQIADGATASWTITNNSNAPVHITSITVYWNSSGNRDLKNVTLRGSSVWTGASGSSGLTITSGGSLPWPIALNVGSTNMALTFSKSTSSIRVVLAFSEPSCSAGLDSNNAP